MNPILKNLLAIVIGIIIGSIINMSIIMLSGVIIPAPLGADITTTEGLKASMHLFQPKHFIFPFLAHALGTLFGAGITAFIVEKNKLNYALIIGLLFLAGGIASVFMLPSPTWYTIIDIVAAYLPMAYLGAIVAKKIKNKTPL